MLVQLLADQVFPHLAHQPHKQAMSISTKVGTSVSLTGQRFTVQMPISLSPAVKASIPATSAVQNVLINRSLIGSKNITTNMVSSQNTANEASNALKRKCEDDDDNDYDNL